MKPAKKIEPGCLALAISKTNPCRVVTVIEFVGVIPHCRCNDLWRVDQMMPWTSRITGDIYEPYWQERSLIRLDDDDLQREIEQEREMAHG